MAAHLHASALRVEEEMSPRVLAWMRRAFAGAFVGLGARLAASER